METENQPPIDRYSNLASTLDSILSAHLQDEQIKRGFFERKIQERTLLSKKIMEHLKLRIYFFRSRQKHIRVWAGSYTSHDLTIQQQADAFEAHINGLEAMIKDELTGSFKEITDLQKDLLEVQLVIIKSQRQASLFEGEYGTN